MLTSKLRSLLISIVTVCIIIGASVAVIAYGRGYRLDITQKSFSSTGLLVATSDPTGAQILVDGKVQSATNATLNLQPGWYTITIVKEGYQPWEKRIRVQGEVVSRADAFLFPANPSLSALSLSGVVMPVVSPDGGKLAYVVPNQNTAVDNYLTNRSGVWVLELTDKPLGLNRDARQVAKLAIVDWSGAKLAWSPDSKQILATLTNPATKLNSYYLLEADRLNDPASAVGNIASLERDWREAQETRDKEKLIGLPEDLIKVATSSMKIVSFSPDETKILYEATRSGTLPQIIKPPLIGSNPTAEIRDTKQNLIYVYDIKEDRNYALGEAKSLSGLQWLPNSKHLLVTEKDKIEVLEFDGGNRKTIYAGPFWDGFVVPWTSGTKLLILTNLNPSASAENNLYAVNLR